MSNLAENFEEKSSKTRRTFFGNVPYDITKEELKKIFEDKVGEVESIELFKDEKSRPRGCGIVSFKDAKNIAKAVEMLNQRFEIGTRIIYVKEDFGAKRDRYGHIKSNQIKDNDNKGSKSQTKKDEFNNDDLSPQILSKDKDEKENKGSKSEIKKDESNSNDLSQRNLSKDKTSQDNKISKSEIKKDEDENNGLSHRILKKEGEIQDKKGSKSQPKKDESNHNGLSQQILSKNKDSKDKKGSKSQMKKDEPDNNGLSQQYLSKQGSESPKNKDDLDNNDLAEASKSKPLKYEIETYGLSKHFLKSLGITRPPLSNKVFVSNLNCDKVNDKNLWELFGICGRVRNIHLLADKNGNKLGYAIIELDNSLEAIQAISTLHNQTYYGYTLNIRLAKDSDYCIDFKLPDGLASIGRGFGQNGKVIRNITRNLNKISPEILEQQRG